MTITRSWYSRIIPPQVQKARKTYEAVKIKLRAMCLKYMLMFPAKLKVLHDGRAHFFSTPQEAWDWATESPNIKCNPAPQWGSGAAPKERRPNDDYREEGGKHKRRRSRSRRNRIVMTNSQEGIGLEGGPPDGTLISDSGDQLDPPALEPEP